ncbi:MAG: hypothetical protein QM781_00135 [Chitinophagaceae bacterium]
MKNKLLLASFTMAALAFTVLPVAAQKTSTSTEIRSVYTDDDETTLNFSRDEHQYKIRMTGNKITEMYRDGVKVASEDYSKYESMINEVLAEVKKQREEAEKMRQEAEVQRKQADKQRQEAEKQRKEADAQRLQAEKQREEAEEQRKQADVFRAEAEKQRGQAEKQRFEAEKQRTEADKMRLEAEQQRKKADEFRAGAEVQRKEAEKQRAEAEVQRREAEKNRALMEKMLDEIVTEKIVSSRDDLKTIQLDDKEFVVNGVKQTDKLHSQFKAKYLKGKQIRYERNDSFRRISMD